MRWYIILETVCSSLTRDKYLHFQKSFSDDSKPLKRLDNNYHQIIIKLFNYLHVTIYYVNTENPIVMLQTCLRIILYIIDL